MADRAGFIEYVGARRALMHRTAFVLTGDHHHAEDLVQQVLTRLYVRWPKVERMDSVDGYVRRMLVNANVDRVRRRREHADLDTVDLPVQPFDSDSVLDLHQALATLAPGQRRVVVLRHLWGLSVEETAETLGVAPGTVKSQTADAINRLRDLMAPTEPRREP